jgi:hypothetical protein
VHKLRAAIEAAVNAKVAIEAKRDGECKNTTPNIPNIANP